MNFITMDQAGASSVPAAPGNVSSAAVAAAMPGVLVVDHSSKLAGAELILLDVASGLGAGSSAFLFEDGPLREALVDRGVAVTVSRRASSFAVIKRDRSLTRALPHIAGFAAVIMEITRQARRHRLIYANSQKAFVLAAPAALMARRKLVWHLHDILSPAHFGAAQRRLVVMLANRFAACVVVPSTATAASFIAAGGRASLVHVVANGVDVAPETASRSQLRAELGLPEGFLFGVFSRLAPWKGQDVALQALAEVPGAHCVVAGAALFGEDDYASGLHDLVARLGVADRVQFLGHRRDVSRLMRAMDAVVHPSVQPEPFGRTLVEAMLCRVPVVATSAGAPDEILEGGSSGFLVPPGDASALAATLRAIQTGSVDLATVINRAELRAKHLYSANRMVTSVRDLVDRLAPVPA